MLGLPEDEDVLTGSLASKPAVAPGSLPWLRLGYRHSHQEGQPAGMAEVLQHVEALVGELQRWIAAASIPENPRRYEAQLDFIDSVGIDAVAASYGVMSSTGISCSSGLSNQHQQRHRLKGCRKRRYQPEWYVAEFIENNANRINKSIRSFAVQLSCDAPWFVCCCWLRHLP